MVIDDRAPDGSPPPFEPGALFVVDLFDGERTPVRDALSFPPVSNLD